MILPGAIQVPRPDKGAPYRLTCPPKWVLHSIECRPDFGRKGLVTAASQHPHPPHFWVDMVNRIIVQTIDTNRSAEALAHPRGATVETNHAQARQVEIAGWAKDFGTYPDDWFLWLRDALLIPVAEADGIDLHDWPLFPPYPDSYGNNGVRFSDQQWLDHNGGCGHMHVPGGNDHGDPGAVKAHLLKPPPEDDMTPAQEAKLDALVKAVAKLTIDVSTLKKHVLIAGAQDKRPERSIQEVQGLMADKLGV